MVLPQVQVVHAARARQSIMLLRSMVNVSTAAQLQAQVDLVQKVLINIMRSMQDRKSAFIAGLQLVPAVPVQKVPLEVMYWDAKLNV